MTSPLTPAQWPDRYGDELYRFARGRVQDPIAAEELVQDTFLSALGAVSTFRGDASERTWLFVILKRKLIDYYRRQARATFVGLETLDDSGPRETDFFIPTNGHWADTQAPMAWQNAEAALEQEETHEALRRCQQRLTPQQQAVFALRFEDDLPAEDICRELSISPANYWVIIHRAKLRLRRCLEKAGFGR